MNYLNNNGYESTRVRILIDYEGVKYSDEIFTRQ